MDMFKILDAIAKTTSRVEASILDQPDPGSIVSIPNPKPGFYGIAFANDILMVDYESAMSFRVEYGNIGLHKKMDVYRARDPFPISVLTQYFAENKDNPFALMYVIGRMALRGDVVTPLTQVPPRNHNVRGTRDDLINKLLQETQPMDVLFSRPLAAGNVSQLLRRIGSCQFSHVGTCVGDGFTVDAGPNGVTRNSITELAKTAHLALYRLRQPLSEEQRAETVRFTKSQVGSGYNWTGVLDLFLRKKIGLKSRAPSVSDMLFSDLFQLVICA